MSKLLQIDSLHFMSNFDGPEFFQTITHITYSKKEYGKLRLIYRDQITTNSRKKTVMTTNSINSSSCPFQVIKKPWEDSAVLCQITSR